MTTTFLFVVVVSCAAGRSSSSSPSRKDISKVEKFAVQFGYLPPLFATSQPHRTEHLTVAIKKIQRMAGLAQHGKIDSALLEYVERPRCGNPDIGRLLFKLVRTRRFVTDSPQTKWSKRHLTYCCEECNNTGILTPDDVARNLHRAFQVWSFHTSLIFVPTDCREADIKIGFYSGVHGDGADFDGPFGVMGHAFLPRNMGGCSTCGWLHFDADETWGVRGQDGALQINHFLEIATHEIGHILGLQHTTVAGSLMQPDFRNVPANLVALGADDVAGIQTLYGDRDTVYNKDDSNDVCPPKERIIPLPGNLETPCLSDDPTMTMTSTVITTTASTTRPVKKRPTTNAPSTLPTKENQRVASTMTMSTTTKSTTMTQAALVTSRNYVDSIDSDDTYDSLDVEYSDMSS